MVEVVLKVVAEAFINGREIMDTGVSMIGLGGDNAHCGACGREMMHQFPLDSMKTELLFRCSCGSLNEVPGKP